MIGTGSKSNGREGYLVYAMRVTEALSFDEYWKSSRFAVKRPNLRGSKKQAFGDNIYHRHKLTGLWMQVDSHHSLPDGSPNNQNIANDTQADRMLVSDDFIYWGGNGPAIPRRFRSFQGFDICGKRGHKNTFPKEMVTDFVAWLRALNESGYRGDPLDWRKTA